MSKLSEGFRRAIGRGTPKTSARKQDELLNSTTLSSPQESLRAAWELTKPYFTKSEERRKAQLMLGMVVGLTLGQVYMDVKLSHWGNGFYKNLQQAGQVLAATANPENEAQGRSPERQSQRTADRFPGSCRHLPRHRDHQNQDEPEAATELAAMDDR